eukprot:symbB.v1.2.038675.t1/scaffold6113.1/size20854/2
MADEQRCSSENTVGANMTYAAAGSKGALGLSFSGGSGSITSLSWRDGCFSDWTVQACFPPGCLPQH